MSRNIETKQANVVFSDGTEVQHNNFITLNGALLATTQGVKDPQSGDASCRIGDEINLRGIAISAFVELNERYSDVTFRMMVIKSAKGDTPTYATLFQNITANKMIDRYNTERFTILASKTFKITAPNYAADGAQALGIGSGVVQAAPNVLSRATKIVKLWVPGKKLGRNGKIKYENESSQVKFFDYTCLLFAYSNYSTSSIPGIPYNVGRCNEFISTLYFKDG